MQRSWCGAHCVLLVQLLVDACSSKQVGNSPGGISLTFRNGPDQSLDPRDETESCVDPKMISACLESRFVWRFPRHSDSLGWPLRQGHSAKQTCSCADFNFGEQQKPRTRPRQLGADPRWARGYVALQSPAVGLTGAGGMSSLDSHLRSKGAYSQAMPGSSTLEIATMRSA